MMAQETEGSQVLRLQWRALPQDPNCYRCWGMSCVFRTVSDTNTTEFISHSDSPSCLSFSPRTKQQSGHFQRGTRTDSVEFYLRFPETLGHVIRHSLRKIFTITPWVLFVVRFQVQNPHSSEGRSDSRACAQCIWCLTPETSIGGGHWGQKPRPHVACQPGCSGEKGIFFFLKFCLLAKPHSMELQPLRRVPFPDWSTQSGCVCLTGLPGQNFF